MTVYVIIAFLCIIIGMVISVSCFGTRGKTPKVFKDIYFSIEDIDGAGILYTKTGEFSAILAMQNPVQKHCADIDNYYGFSNLLAALMATLGDGYSIHKQDVFTRRLFKCEDGGNKEFLSESYFRYFGGRKYTDCTTYITITQENKKSKLFSYDASKWNDFRVKIGKVKDQLKDRGIDSKFLSADEARHYVERFLVQNFTDKNVSLNSFKVTDDQIGLGSRKLKVYSLVDVDSIVMPGFLKPYTNIEVNNVTMPVDLMSLIDSQLWEQNTDVVMVDTGNSYEGLCDYVGGKYISYTEDNPITMNPFRIKQEELNIEKMDFLKNLIMLIWKGNDAVPTKIEEQLIEQCIKEYYEAYFTGFHGYNETQKESLHRKFMLQAISEGKSNDPDIDQKIWKEIQDMEDKRKSQVIKGLSFNTFYEYSIVRLPNICRENHLTGVDLNNYPFALGLFYKGGIYERTLNEDVDSTLFDETFIVFEIDNVKDSKILFPLVTLIIMDVFIQKMRIKKNRKVLVIEETWKAVASPMMAEYIKYLYKTARKFWAMVGVVTQELQDIIGSPIVKEAIINNSDITILLDQGKFKERFDDIKTILGLTDVECRKIFTINRLDNKEGRAFFREVFIRRGIVSEVYGVEEPHECYMTYTTERAEKEALKLYKAELRFSHKDAIKAYCRDWDRSGIAAPIAFAREVNKKGHVLNLKDSKK